MDKFKKLGRFWKIVFLLLALQIPWYVAIQTIVNNTQTKTTAKVIRVVTNSSGCTTAKDALCDRSDRQYPVYEYFDTSGKRYEQDDRFFGEYKKNNPLRLLFGKEVGDTTTAYYTKDKPSEVMFMTGPFAYSAWMIPLYFVFGMFAVKAVLSLYKVYKNHK